MRPAALLETGIETVCGSRAAIRLEQPWVVAGPVALNLRVD